MSDRRPNPADPSAERTSETSTPSASGLGGGRAGMEQARRDDDHDELIPRHGEDDRATPRRHDEPDADPVMPTEDSSLGTKI
jgi:hypothetical protein